MTQGRPSTFTDELALDICTKLAEGMSLRSICDIEGMPAVSTVCKWLNEKPSFSEQYAQARKIQAELMADELLDIADDGRNDWMLIKRGKEEIEVVNKEAIQRSALRVDTRKWIASRLLPKKFGDKVTQEHTGEGGGPIVFKVERVGK
jgi:hypothetical protein